jgi:cytochrome P450
MMQVLSKRYGSAFTVRLPFFGPTVIIADPALVKQFFQTRTDVVRNVEPNLDLVLGPGSTFGLQGEEHRRRRKLLVPPTRTAPVAAVGGQKDVMSAQVSASPNK